MEVWSVLQGTGTSYKIFLEDPQTGAPYSGYTGLDVLSAEIWAGDDQEVLAVPIVAWLDAAGGELLVSIGSNISAQLEPGRYKLAVYVILEESGERAEVETVWLDVNAAPGGAVTIPTYCTEDDLFRESGGDLRRLQDVEVQAGFREERGVARDWTDGLIQASYTGTRWPRGDYTLDHLLPGWVRNRGGDDHMLQAWLDADRLVLTGPSGAKVRRANALYALSVIYGSQLVKEGETQYQKLAAKFNQMANALISTAVVKVDTSDAGDGSSAYIRGIGPLGRISR